MSLLDMAASIVALYMRRKRLFEVTSVHHPISIQTGTYGKSHYATAAYYRMLYRETNPMISAIPDAAFWHQTKEQSETRGPDVEDDEADNMDLDYNEDQIANVDKTDPSEDVGHPCSDCQTSITPFTIQGIFEHRLSMGHKTVIDLDPHQLLVDNPHIDLSKVPDDFASTLMLDTEVEDDSKSETDEDASFSNDLEHMDSLLQLGPYAENVEDHVDGSSTDPEPGVPDISKEDLDNGTLKQEDQPIPLDEEDARLERKEHKRNLKSMFLQSLKTECIRDVQEIMNKYTGRGKWRIKDTGHTGTTTRLMCAKQLLGQQVNPQKAVYALHKNSGYWYCQVPTCGASYPVDFEFAMALHLDAHAQNDQWYCGDAPCANKAKEEVFKSLEEIEAHIKDKHRDSKFTHQAIRRVPRKDISETQLLNKLDVQYLTTCPQPKKTIRVLHCDTGEWHDEEDEYADEYMDEEKDWLKLANLKKYGLQEDFDINDYRGGGTYVLGQPPVESTGMPSDFQLLSTSGVYNGPYFPRDEIKKIVETYHAFCKELGSHDRDLVLSCLRKQVGERLEPTIDSQSRLGCPWPNCDYSIKFKHDSRHVMRHYLCVHLRCRWQCIKQGCEFCAYRGADYLERHRMFCHVGSSLQCGHACCDQVLVHGWNSSGHLKEHRFREHLELIFNAKLGNTIPRWTSSVSTPRHPDLTSREDYLRQFGGSSGSDYFTTTQLSECRVANSEVLQRRHLTFKDTQIINTGTKCAGFYLEGSHFPCAAEAELDITHARLIFVPALMEFTMADCCDYCFSVMPVISRPLAELPNPFEFGVSQKESTRIDRVGIGSPISDHASFREYVSKSPLPLSVMAEKYRDMLERSPENIITTDFEGLIPCQKGMPVVPTEVTFRDGNGKVILSAIINDEGVTNAEFEEKIKKLGYTDKRSLQSCRRIRGKPNQPLKNRSMTPKQILKELRKSGFGRSTFWKEYSLSFYDRRCMEEVVRQAGESPDDFLPPRSQCWKVCQDFMRCLPGLGTSYSLGNVARLMNPAILNGLQLHTSRADTFVLHQILRHWVSVYGVGASGASTK